MAKPSEEVVRLSKLMEGPSYTDHSFVNMRNNFIRGSRLLAAAVLKSGKLYGPMSEAAQIEAVEYAYDVNVTLKGKNSKLIG